MERKVKYDYTFKLECVEMVLKKHYSNNDVSKLKCIDVSNIRKWVNFYQQYGKAGLLPRKNQHYTQAFKLKVIKTIRIINFMSWLFRGVVSLLLINFLQMPLC